MKNILYILIAAIVALIIIFWDKIFPKKTVSDHPGYVPTAPNTVTIPNTGNDVMGWINAGVDLFGEMAGVFGWFSGNVSPGDPNFIGPVIPPEYQIGG